MTRGRPVNAIAASPTLVGAVTVLIAVVAVWLAYNAAQGLPFVPTYRVSVEVPNAARMVPNNEVRIGGNRVGLIESIEPVQREDGSTGALLNLKLDQEIEPLPSDTGVRIRYQSAFGLKYVELERGAVEGVEVEPIPEGGTIPAGHSVEQEEFDDLLSTFDESMRLNIRGNLEGYGSAFAARGMSLNRAIEAFNPLFRNLEPVMRVLADPETRFGRFFRAAGRSAGAVAPVADRQAELFTHMADTFEAFSRDVGAFQETISRSAPTQQAGIESFRVQRPFLRNFTRLSGELRPAIRELPRTLPSLNRAFAVGIRNLPRTPPMNRELGRVFASLERLVEQPETEVAVRRIGGLFESLESISDHLGPAQTVCNQVNLSFHRLWEHLSEEDSAAHAQRIFSISGPPGFEQENPINGYAGERSNGINALTGVFDPEGIPVARGNSYGPVVDEQGNADCQSGQFGMLQGRVPGENQPIDDPGVTVSNLPGSRGANFFARERRP